MLPMLLLVGLVTGALVHDRLSLEHFVVVAVVASLLWGIAVGVADRSLATLAGGTALALSNVAVGGAVSAAARNVVRLRSTRPRP